MKTRSIWILLAILVAVAAYFFLIEEKRKIRKEKERKSSVRLLPYGPTGIDSFTLINPEGKRITVASSDGDWLITRPVVYKGDKPTIDLFVSMIAPGQKLETLEDVANLADFGLTNPFAAVIIFAEDRDRPDTLFVGDKTPTSSRCYVRLGSENRVFVTRELTHNVMNKSLYHLRDKYLFDFDRDAVDGFDFINGPRTISVRREGNVWWLGYPRVRADSKMVLTYIEKITEALIREFVDEDAHNVEQYGITEAGRRIVLHMGTDSTIISFGRTKGDLVYAKRSGLDKILLLDGKIPMMLDLSADDLRDTRLAFFDPKKVESITYETPDTVFTAVFDNGQWLAVGANIPAISQYGMFDFLQALSLVHFDEIYPEPYTEIDRRFARFSIRTTLEDRHGGVIDRIIAVRSAPAYEIGASISSGAVGRLKRGSISKIEHKFSLIASPH